MAVTITDSELAGQIGADAETATRLLKLAMEIVTRYVNNSDTPEVILRMRRVFDYVAGCMNPLLTGQVKSE